jgi:predicted kinase
MRNKLAVIADEEQKHQEQEEYQDPLSVFIYALKAPETRRQWPRRLKVFFDFLKLEEPIEEQAKQFLLRTKQDFQWAQHSLFRFMTFQQERVKQSKISEATVPNYYKAIKLFCEMNDIVFNWKKITRGMPRVRQAANDRAPAMEELRRLIEYPDRRIIPIVYTMVSSGIRIGAWDYLRWKHVKPITNDKEEIIVAKLAVYAGDREEYYSFITPEAYTSLNEWMDFRTSYGEKITGESWLMRDIWQTTNIDYGAKLGLATCPKKLKSSGIKRLLERALWEQGIRQPLREGTKRHEWKAAHGFRKFYKSRGEQVMKPINVEITMGHNVGISKSYYKPTEREVMEDYLKAVPLLQINADNLILQKQVEELTEKSKDNEYTIRAKLQEKDEQIKTITNQFSEIKNQMQSLISSLSSMNETEKSNFAKQLFRGGIYKKDYE